MRYPSRNKISAHDFALLLSTYYAFVKTPTLGECRSDGTYTQFIKELDDQFSIELTPKQIAVLTWYFKEGCAERLKLCRGTLPNNWNGMFRRLKRQAPHLFKEEEDGEIIMRDGKETGMSE